MNHLFAIVMILLTLGTTGLSGQKDGDPVRIGTYRVLSSKALVEERTLLVSLPRDYDRRKDAFPVLYMLYGNHTRTYFARSVDILNRLGAAGDIPEMILVGIVNTDRYRDLLPRTADGKETGIENFARFLGEELFPFVEGQYRTKSYRAFLGPQVGANFLFYAAFRHPELFAAGIAENPFRWQGGRDFLIDEAKRFLSGREAFRKTLYFTCNDNDRLEREGSTHMKAFEEFLSGLTIAGFDMKVTHIQNHREFLAPFNLEAGLKYVFRNYPFSFADRSCKLADIRKFYQERSREYGYPVDIPEHNLVMAYDRLVKSDTGSAAELLDFILETNPTSGNGLWRKHEILLAAGQRKEAVACLKKMLAVMTSDTGMIEKRIRQLESESK